MMVMSLEWLTWICINDKTASFEIAVEALLPIECVEHVHDNRCIRDLVGREIAHPSCLDHSAVNSWLCAAVVYDLIQLLLRRRRLHHTPRCLDPTRIWLYSSFPTLSLKNSEVCMYVYLPE